MSSPLLLLSLPALLLAYPIYATFKRKNRSTIAFEKLKVDGFIASSVFEMTDFKIAIDKENNRIALIDLEHFIIPRGMNPPIDRDSFSVRKTEVIDANDIDFIRIHIQSTGYIDCALIYKAPNNINSTQKQGINFHSTDKPMLLRMLKDWPTRSVVENLSK